METSIRSVVVSPLLNLEDVAKIRHVLRKLAKDKVFKRDIRAFKEKQGNKNQNYARLHYLLKDDLMKMEAIAKETRLLCRNHIDTAQQLLSYKGLLETEMSALLEKRKELYSKSRSAKDEDAKSQVKAELSDI